MNDKTKLQQNFECNRRRGGGQH